MKYIYFFFLQLSYKQQRTIVYAKIMSNITDCSIRYPPNYLSLLSTVFAAVFCLVITVANILVIFAVVIDPLKKLRSPFNYFVVNLAVADSVVGTITMPIGIYLHSWEFLKDEPDVHLMKKIFHYALFVSLTASLLCLITLSIDRYIAITFPMQYRSNLTLKKCWFGSFVIWTLSLSFPIIYFETDYIDFLMIYINSAVVIAAFALIMTYIRVYKFLRAQTQLMKEITRTTATEKEILEAKRMSQQKRITRVFLWVLVLFLVCYIPGAAVIYTLQLCVKCSTLQLYAICSCKSYHIMRDVSFYFLTVNSCMNPFVYAFRNKHYRHALMALCTRSRETGTEKGVRTTQYGSLTM